uniref:Uncharacterized protein n=1 Tax=Romanomermis culicivorax TaxID=13658 RepID=A0A915KNS6_ROMCU
MSRKCVLGPDVLRTVDQHRAGMQWLSIGLAYTLITYLGDIFAFSNHGQRNLDVRVIGTNALFGESGPLANQMNIWRKEMFGELGHKQKV